MTKWLGTHQRYTGGGKGKNKHFSWNEQSILRSQSNFITVYAETKVIKDYSTVCVDTVYCKRTQNKYEGGVLLTKPRTKCRWADKNCCVPSNRLRDILRLYDNEMLWIHIAFVIAAKISHSPELSCATHRKTQWICAGTRESWTSHHNNSPVAVPVLECSINSHEYYLRVLALFFLLLLRVLYVSRIDCYTHDTRGHC